MLFVDILLFVVFLFFLWLSAKYYYTTLTVMDHILCVRVGVLLLFNLFNIQNFIVPDSF